MDKKISIIIPVYNVEKYIEKCLESVVNQSYRNIEIIIIIDGSKDNSIEIANKFTELDDRIILVNRENKGVMYTRLEGIKIASGDFIVFVDADDWIDRDMCMILLKNQEKYNADIVKTSHYVVDDMSLSPVYCIDKNTFIEKKDYIEKVYNVFIEKSSFNAMWGQLIRKSLAEKIICETDIVVAEDLNYNLALYTESLNIVLLKENLYYYRNNPESVTQNLNYVKIKKHLRDIIYVYGKLFDYIKIWRINNNEMIKKVSLRVLKEITARTLLIYRVMKFENKEIDDILNLGINNNVLVLINKNLKRKDIKKSNFNKKYAMRAIYDRKKWKVNLYGKYILHKYIIFKTILKKYIR